MKSPTAILLLPLALPLVGATLASAAPATHWAFQPVRLSPLPQVARHEWPRTPIDRFILARLETEHLAPSPEADRPTLIRRLSLDLTGLPPAPAEVDAFVADPQPDAYERLVDRLLASPHYGERWGRHWLDLARYADSNGYSIDAPRSMWRYRDWVIHAFNRDLPYDQFLLEQTAGDLLPDPTLDQRLATAFHRNTQINEEGGIDKEQFRIEAVVDRVNTTGAALLGLTLGCAQCHDHKSDPITQREYFRLFAFFNNQDEPVLDTPTPDEATRLAAHRAQIEATEKALAERRRTLEQEQARDDLEPAQPSSAEPETQPAPVSSPDPASTHPSPKPADARVKKDPAYRELQIKLADLKKNRPPSTTTLVLQERSEPRTTHVHVKGDFTRLGEAVQPGVPACLPALASSASPTSPNRLDLARWLVDPAHPLTARVMMNRLWHHCFGRALVETMNDFGTQGSLPTHPELLDWLAHTFVAQGWSLKAMHRLIVTSATYRQSSRLAPQLAQRDPQNKWLARQSRLRLEAEIIRDVALAASGLLTWRIGGPSTHPPIPEGVMSLGQSRREWKASQDADRYRRGLYTFFWRATPYPALMVFDAPDAFSTCTRRLRSNTPLQSLTLLNDAAFLECSQALAGRLLLEAAPHARLDHAFRLCLARPPHRDETDRLQQLLDEELALFRKQPKSAELVAGPQTTPAGDLSLRAGWTTVARVLLNLDETITRE